jgi:hypothetical protein
MRFLVCTLLFCTAQAQIVLPPEGPNSCVASLESWTSPKAEPGITLTFLPNQRYRLGTKSSSVEGSYRAESLSDPQLKSLFSKGSSLSFLSTTGQVAFTGAYGVADKPFVVFLIKNTRNNTTVYVRCPESIPQARPAGAAAPTTTPATPTATGAAPPAGYYSCITTDYLISGGSRVREYIGNNNSPGFDLYADGNYAADSKSSIATGKYTFEASSGVVTWQKGLLSIYFKNPRLKGNLLELVDLRSDGSVDQIIRCTRTKANTKPSASEVLAARIQKNLNPDPPGKTRMEGLYASVSWVSQVGANNTFYQTAEWDFYYFQSNGYVYRSEPSLDMQCTKPTVDASGDSLCTTYNIDGGRLRVNGESTPFRRNAKGFDLSGRQYSLLKPYKGKLNVALRYFSYDGVGLDAGNITFSPDGSFSSDRTVGVLYSSDPSGTQPRVDAAGSSKKGGQGKYTLNGFKLTLTYSDGRQETVFFSELSKGLFRIGDTDYLRK